MDVNRKATPKSYRRWLLLLPLISIAAVAAAYSRGAGVPEVARQSLWIGTAQRGDILRELRAAGRLSPRTPRIIAAAGGGQVERILVRPGAIVESNSILLELSNPAYEERIREAESDWHAALAARADLIAQLHEERLNHKLELGRLRLDLDSARFDVDAARRLSTTAALSAAEVRRIELRNSQLQMRLGLERERGRELPALHEARVDAAEARVQHLQARVGFMRQRRDELVVRAGSAGVIQDLSVEAGQRVAAGEVLARIADPADLKVELRVPERQAGELRPGLKVRVDLRSTTLQAEIVRIDPAVSGGLILVDAELQEALPDNARPGQSLEAAIELETINNTVHIERPAAATNGSHIQLFVLRGNQAERRLVQLGRGSVSRVAVLAGLQAGDLVVLSNMDAWEGVDRIRLE